MSANATASLYKKKWLLPVRPQAFFIHLGLNLYASSSWPTPRRCAPPSPAKRHLASGWLRASGHRLLQALAVLCLLWAFHAPASAACSITMTADATAATTGTVYDFSSTENTGCKVNLFGIADGTDGFVNTQLSQMENPLSTTGGGKLYVYQLGIGPAATGTLRYIAPLAACLAPTAALHQHQRYLLDTERHGHH